MWAACWLGAMMLDVAIIVFMIASMLLALLLLVLGVLLTLDLLGFIDLSALRKRRRFRSQLRHLEELGGKRV